MPALVFDLSPARLARAKLRGLRDVRGYFAPGGPLALREVPRPALVADDWVIVRTVFSGICGSDLKELTLDGALDNPIRSLISFPQVMGHEVVGVVEEAGPKAARVRVGDRVAVSPWFPCKPRGLDPAPLVTHRFALAEYLQALETFAARRGTGAVKVVFDFQ